ncbi:hypothetical protein BOTBODRAFT_177390 [Botryobasidium botryosum FD-172 SS1]|uniref:Amino acid permease/ SLC12A domain-containing protein n=1 Tax=Botryobasidium botryosum (strain FD-172 SS1) TaxID=930990 RepID=A0A067MII9_BOTB1|nr:hypothetical protein BOTBODRAFT_177390 [Botryobasidium botryosum FD-172 SS1]
MPTSLPIPSTSSKRRTGIPDLGPTQSTTPQHENDSNHPSVRRGLRERHVQMVSLAGMIGTGLFLGSGKALADAGPVGALLGYSVMGIITAAVAYTAAETSAFMPLSGGFVRHTANFIEPCFGAAVGWNFWYAMSITQATEIVAAGILASYWAPNVHNAVWVTVFWVPATFINLAPVRYYGEIEFVFALLKLSLVIGLIVLGLILDLGGAPDHDRIGFRYWIDPGPFQQLKYAGGTIPGGWGRFLAVLATLINASFAFGNVQLAGIAGAETINPRKTIPVAASRTAFRIVVFYLFSIFVIGLIVPSTHPSLRDTSGTVTQSPFVIAIKAAGIRTDEHVYPKTLPSIINAIVMTSAFSSGVSCVFFASRILLGLEADGLAPKIFARTNRWGTPYMAVLATASFGSLAFLSVSAQAFQALIWLINLSAVGGLISWIALSLAYIRFHAAMAAQGYSRKGFTVFLKNNFSVAGFLSNYANVFVFLGLYTFWKIFKRSRVLFIPASEIDLSEFEVIRAEVIEQATSGQVTPVVVGRKEWLYRVIDRIF